MREFSKSVVKTFDQVVKNEIEPEKIETFLEVAYKINEIVNSKKIFKKQSLLAQK
jgi:ribosomal protein S20